MVPYLWCALLSVGLIAWGVKDRRELLVNLGIAGFALTVTGYYFSDVMDRLGRSASLIGMGLLFLGGGYLLERARREAALQAPGGTVTRRRAGIVLAIAHVGAGRHPWTQAAGGSSAAPRAWARTLPYDPSLPIRGRYVRLRLEVPLDSTVTVDGAVALAGVRLEARDGRLQAVPDSSAASTVTIDSIQGSPRAALVRPVAFFIPEHVPDPSRRNAGEELWVEVTIPRRGPPRPIRLGVRTDGAITPLDLR